MCSHLLLGLLVKEVSLHHPSHHRLLKEHHHLLQSEQQYRGQKKSFSEKKDFQKRMRSMTYAPPTLHAKRKHYYFLSCLYNSINYSQCLIWIDAIPRSHQQKRKVYRALIPNLLSLECVHLHCKVGSVGILPSSVPFLELELSSALC